MTAGECGMNILSLVRKYQTVFLGSCAYLVFLPATNECFCFKAAFYIQNSNLVNQHLINKEPTVYMATDDKDLEDGCPKLEPT